MAIDAREAAGFYATPLGRLTAGLLRKKLSAIWPSCTGLTMLGLGFTTPYLSLWQAEARCIAVSPAAMGAAPWPAGAPSLACIAEEESLPFADLSFDRILLVHGLEQAGHARRTLREVWRLLKDDGRLIIVAPNRRGMWAYMESTPFGHGQPYSEAQLTRLLQGQFFSVTSRQQALFAPPFDLAIIRKSFQTLETLGHALTPTLAGLTIAEATKDMLGIIPAKPRRAGRRVLVDAGG